MDILKALRIEEAKYRQQLETIQTAIKLLGGKPAGKNGRKKRHVSASARAKMAKAQKARWAKIRAAKKNAKP